MRPKPGHLLSNAFYCTLVILLLSSCDNNRNSLGNAGTAVAVEVHNRALITATEMKETPHPVCARYPITDGQALSVEVLLSLSSTSAPLYPISLEERRLLEIDPEGNMRYRRQTEYTTELGRQGERMREWRLVSGQLYTREDNLDFERRPALPSDRDLLFNQATDPFPALVSITSPNWTAVNSTAEGWQIAVTEDEPRGEHLSCGRSLDLDPWILALEGDLAVLDASATVSTPERNGPYRSRRGTWRMASGEQETDAQLHISVEETVSHDPPEDPIIAPTQLAELGRNRSHQQLNRFILQLSDEVDRRLEHSPDPENQDPGH